MKKILFARKAFARGFTLIELLVVVAIIALLASIILASLNTARSRARDATRIADMKEVQLALALYFNDHGSYPVNTGAQTWSAVLTPTLVPTYMPALPADPGSNTFNYASTNNGTACTSGTCNGFIVEAQLESTLPAGTQTGTTTTVGTAVCATANTYCMTN